MLQKISTFCSALWRKVFNFYVSQSAKMNCYFTAKNYKKIH